MGNWVKDQFLQKPEEDPWTQWTLADLELASADIHYPAEDRKRMRVEIKARQQGLRARSQASGGSEHG